MCLGVGKRVTLPTPSRRSSRPVWDLCRRSLGEGGAGSFHLDPDEDLHKSARTSVSIGPMPLAREGHSDFGCLSPIPLSSHSACRVLYGGTQA